MTKIFLTGATGFIGGSALHQISSSIPSAKISCLIRDVSKAAKLRELYPDVNLVEGNLDDAAIIETEAANADIVLHLASTNHEGSARAILKGLTRPRHDRPSFWIQMSGATMVAASELKNGRYGQAPDTEYDDLRDDGRVRSMIADNPARAVDNIIISTKHSGLHTSLIAGPCIYGQGLGPVNIRSIQCPEIARVTLERRKGFRLGQGLNVWSNVHIQDLGDFFVALVRAAISGNYEAWNEKGLYFPSHASLSFGDIYTKIAVEAKRQGYIDDEGLDVITAEQANAMSTHAAAIWGTNADLHSSRAQVQLGWRPFRESLLDTIPNVIRVEAERLRLSNAMHK